MRRCALRSQIFARGGANQPIIFGSTLCGHPILATVIPDSFFDPKA